MENILIVDDNLTYVEGLRAILQEQGYAVDFSLAVHDALEKIKTNEYDLIFVDMKMRDFTGEISERAGLDFVPLIKSKSPKSKIVMLTAGSRDTDAVETIEQGAVKYLRKGNFGIDYLLKLISQLLEKEDEQRQDEPEKIIVKNSFFRWLLERGYSILDEVLAGLLLTAFLYIIGSISGILSASPVKWLSSKGALLYVFVGTFIVIFVILVYIAIQKKHKHNRDRYRRRTK